MEGEIQPAAQPQLLGENLNLPFSHPMSPDAFSRRDPNAVTCSSCHSPHLSMREEGTNRELAPGIKKLSPRNRNRFEYELCQDCHGSQGAGATSVLDISRLTSPSSRSYHPIEAPIRSSSPSVRSGLIGREINCSDCHGNSEPSGARGIHGSRIQYVLRESYTATDGIRESEVTYALCYSCHDREAILSPESTFPLHRSHVSDLRASCSTCHSSHGSVNNRALIRFGEESVIGQTVASPSTGRLEFLSEFQGTGECYLSCHGVDHAPGRYDGFTRAVGSSRGVSPAGSTTVGPALGPPSGTPRNEPPLVPEHLPPRSRPKPQTKPPP